MTLLQADFESLDLWDTCLKANKMIVKALKNASQTDFDSLFRWSEAVNEVANLRHISAWRFSDAMDLHTLDVQLDHYVTQLSAFVEQEDPNFAALAEEALVPISEFLSKMPSPVMSTEQLKEMTVLTQRYQSGIGQALGQAKKASRDAQTELQKVVSAKEAALVTLSQQMEDLKDSIADGKADVSAQAARLDTALTTNNTAFNTKVTEWQDSLDTDRKEAKAAAAKQLTLSEEEAKEHVRNLENLEEQSRKLTEATARNSISTEYGVHAQQQNTTATVWSVCAVGLAVGGLIALFLMIEGIANITPAEAIWKTSVSALTIAIATYMGREAAGHRKDARDAKRMQLDLNALEPFLANMDEDTAHDLREQFARQIFSRPLANSKEHSGFTWLSGGSGKENSGKSNEEAAE